MFTDTHCHLSYLSARGADTRALLTALKEAGTPFIMDAGTKAGDFQGRLEEIESHADGEIPSFVHFGCGLWPAVKAIHDRFDQIMQLEADVEAMLNRSAQIQAAGGESYAALGECGLDRFWNGEAARSRIEAGTAQTDDGPGTVDTAGEEELFALQIELAAKKNLPLIIHSRDAFQATYGILENAQYHRGVIHCFSYGIAEARAFLDRDWYISFPGTITWGKREADRDRIAALLRYIPAERLLLETDAPYLAPAPFRGQLNTPLLIEHTYRAAAQMLGLPVEALAESVLSNARRLFSVSVTREPD